jgi:phenylalanyl-tRNA synthetase alpha chain
VLTEKSNLHRLTSQSGLFSSLAALSKMLPSRGPVPVVKKESNDRDLAHEILTTLSTKDSFTSADAFPNVSQQEFKSALDRVASRSMVLYDTIDKELVLLTPEGQAICEEGSHEYKVWDLVRRKGKVSMKELSVRS